MNVPNFAHKREIQRAYRALAKRYHPDVNSSPTAEETFVVVSKAYQTLIDPPARKFHDTQLREALLWESEGAYRRKMRKMKQAEYSREKRKRWAYQSAQREINEFERNNKRFSYTNRIVLGVVGVLCSLLIIFKNYFINLNANELPLVVLGFATLTLSSVLILAGMYRKMRISSILKKNSRPYEKWSFGLFFLILITGPLLVFGISEYRMSYHLKNYPILATATIIEITYDEMVLFSFKPSDSDQVIMKRKQLTESHIYNEDEGWIIVRYSRADPRIVELVEQVN